MNNPKPASITQFQDYLNSVYGHTNEPRQVEYLYSYLFRNVAYLSRVIGEQGNPTTNFMKSFSWLFELSSKLQIGLEEAFMRKYPKSCPYCISMPCACARTNKSPLNMHSQHYHDAYIPEYTIQKEMEAKYNVYRRSNPALALDTAVKDINLLYQSNLHIWSAAGPTFQFYRILEELGEVHEAYASYCSGKRDKESIEQELADVFAWLLSTWGICFNSQSLQDTMIDYYLKGCPVCKSETCECPDHGDRGERLLQTEQLMEFKSKIEELLQVAPEYNEKLNGLLDSIDQVAESKSTPRAARIVNQVKSIMKSISFGLSSANDATGHVSSIVDSIDEIIDKLPWV